MKIFISFFVASLLFCTNITAQYPSSKMVILVKDGAIRLNKKEVSKDWTAKTFASILDTFCRKKVGTSYKIFSYDNIGIVEFETVVQKMPTGAVTEFQIYLDENEATSTAPKEFYEGKINLEKLSVTRNTLIDDIRKTLKAYKEMDSDENDKYRFSKNGNYFYFLYNKNKKLSKVIFGKEKTS